MTMRNNDGNNRVAVRVGRAAPELERFAAAELCRYLEPLFGILVQPTTGVPITARAIILIGKPPAPVSDQGIVFHRTEVQGRPALIVGGGSPRATLWAVYELVERWGVRYLTDRDVLPDKKQRFTLPDLEVVMEPALRVRAHPTIQDFAASGESWGIKDFGVLFDQLAKLKFNRVNIYPYGWQPYLDWQCKGIRRRSASLWFDYRYHITPDTVGRELFGGAAEFWNPDLPLTSDYEKLVAAGVRQIHNLMAHAHRRGLDCAIAAPLTDFPPEFAPLLKGAEKSHQLGGLTIVPGQKTPLDDPALHELATAALRATVNTYPEADLVTVWMPEYRQWTGEYKHAWRALDARYRIGDVLSLDEALAAARIRGARDGDAERAVNEVKADLASLYFYERLLRHAKALKGLRRADIKFMYWGPVEELFPILDRILPHGWEMGAMFSNHPSVLLKRIEVLKTLPKQIPGVMDLTLDDDNIGVLPQLTTHSLHKLIQVMKRHGWAGIVARERFPGDHDWPMNYLARAAWGDKITPDDVARDLIGAICGDKSVDDLLAAFHAVEAVTKIFAPTNFAFPADWPPANDSNVGGMLLKHWKHGPMPKYMVEARRGYQQALAAARRAQRNAKPSGRWYADFWVGRLEFAKLYVEAVQTVQRAATAQHAKNRPATLRLIDSALDTLRQALEAYARVARDRTDRGAIAVVNEHCYRPLKHRCWYLRVHWDWLKTL